MSKLFGGLFKRNLPHQPAEKLPQSTHHEHGAQHQDTNQQQAFYPKQIVVGSGQSIGMQRDHNEDALYTLTGVLADGQVNESFGLFILADGMGGHRNGEIASGVTCRVIANFIMAELKTNILEDAHSYSPERFTEIIRKANDEAQTAVMKNAPGGGTTVIIALIVGDSVTVSNVGDSRIYFIFPDGRMQKITRDHSLVQRLVDLKEITESEAEVHPQKNVLLRAIGQPDPYQADTQTMSFPPGARILLCSDGLWGVVDEHTIVEVVNSVHDPILACKTLVDAANRNGGPDNISVIIAGKNG